MSDDRRAAALLAVLAEAEAHLRAGFGELASPDPSEDPEAIRAVLLEVAGRLRDNFPYPEPLYAGQMLKPPHPVARLAHALAQWINPNNHAYDGGRASSEMEKEAVAELASMFGWRGALGHLCGGGTVANLEALWVASRLAPGKHVVASTQAHYTHERISGVLGIPFATVAVDARARMDLDALERRLADGDVGLVVATAGTTSLGAVDPIDAIVRLRDRHGFRLHVDAAYGGYFTLAGALDPPARAAFDAIGAADSVCIDPHKHGLQPYGCGCVMFRDPSVGRLYRHDSPYTYFTSAELHLGEITLECSRPGASAVALWATQRLLPLVAGGAFAAGLDRCRAAALALHARLEADARFAPVARPELDIVVWAVRAASASAASARAREVFAACAREGLHLALAEVPRALAEPALGAIAWDRDAVTCLRSCLIKWEHGAWLDAIWARLDRAAAQGAAGGTTAGAHA